MNKENLKESGVYTFRQFYIPKNMMPELQRYIEDHIKPYDFLCAVLENNLANSVALANEENLKNLRAFTGFLHNEAPAACHGSPEKVREWLSERR